MAVETAEFTANTKLKQPRQAVVDLFTTTLGAVLRDQSQAGQSTLEAYTLSTRRPEYDFILGMFKTINGKLHLGFNTGELPLTTIAAFDYTTWEYVPPGDRAEGEGLHFRQLTTIYNAFFTEAFEIMAHSELFNLPSVLRTKSASILPYFLSMSFNLFGISPDMNSLFHSDKLEIAQAKRIVELAQSLIDVKLPEQLMIDIERELAYPTYEDLNLLDRIFFGSEGMDPDMSLDEIRTSLSLCVLFQSALINLHRKFDINYYGSTDDENYDHIGVPAFVVTCPVLDWIGLSDYFAYMTDTIARSYTPNSILTAAQYMCVHLPPQFRVASAQRITQPGLVTYEMAQATKKKVEATLLPKIRDELEATFQKMDIELNYKRSRVKPFTSLGLKLGRGTRTLRTYEDVRKIRTDLYNISKTDYVTLEWYRRSDERSRKWKRIMSASISDIIAYEFVDAHDSIAHGIGSHDKRSQTAGIDRFLSDLYHISEGRLTPIDITLEYLDRSEDSYLTPPFLNLKLLYRSVDDKGVLYEIPTEVRIIAGKYEAIWEKQHREWKKGFFNSEEQQKIHHRFVLFTVLALSGRQIKSALAVAHQIATIESTNALLRQLKLALQRR